MCMQLKEQYLLYCAELNACDTKEKVKKHNAAMKKLAELYHRVEQRADKSFLEELLHNEHERTRLTVAAHCLGLGIYEPEAKKALSALAKCGSEPTVAFEARATLDTWKQQGYLRF